MEAPVDFAHYPNPKPNSTLSQRPPPAKNPILRGFLLYYISKIVSIFPIISKFLWINAGFGRLRDLVTLNNYQPRSDPTVACLAKSTKKTNAPNTISQLDQHGTEVEKVYLSVLDFHSAYKNGTVSPTQVVEYLLPLIQRNTDHATEHSVAFISSDTKSALREAHASAKRYAQGKSIGILDGVPVAIKDEVDIRGYKRYLGTGTDFTTVGTDGQVETSFCVALLQSQGAIVIGKTSMHELGLDTTNNNPRFGTPRNPFNNHYYCGGSSGGSGYAVGVGLVPVALGVDGGGSIRIPSSYLGIFGLKTSHGRISSFPTPSSASSVATCGPMAANMVDLEISYRIMAQPDTRDPSSALFAPPQPFHGQRKKIIGVYNEWTSRSDPHTVEVFQKALEHFKTELGYTIVEVEIPLLVEGQLAHAMTILTEISSAVPNHTEMEPANQILLAVGSQTPAGDYLRAQRLRNLLMQHLAHIFREHPGIILLTPVTPNVGSIIQDEKNDLTYGCSNGNAQIRSMEYAWLANFTGVPALSIPVGYLKPQKGDGLIPIGIQGMSEWGSEDLLIEWGKDGEKWLHCEGGGRKRPNKWLNLLEESLKTTKV